MYFLYMYSDLYSIEEDLQKKNKKIHITIMRMTEFYLTFVYIINYTNLSLFI